MIDKRLSYEEIKESIYKEFSPGVLEKFGINRKQKEKIEISEKRFSHDNKKDDYLEIKDYGV